MQSRLKWLLAACALTIVAAGIALLWSVHSSVAESQLWRKHASTVLQYAIPPILALFGWTAQQLIAARPRQSTPDQLQEARKALVGRGNEWWRGIPQPAWPGSVLRAGLSPLEVTWSGTAYGQLVSGRTSHVTELAQRFRGSKPFRLAIQGPSGSGKSVFARLLMAELLKTADSGPVPVFLPLWSWDPDCESLHGWIKRRLKEDCPELSDTTTFGPTAVTNLVDQGMVLPILDGLDFLPKDRQAKVFDDGGLTSQDRLVLTCRANQPERPDGFTVITPQPVRSGEACRFLGAVTTYPAACWGAHVGQDDFADMYSDPRLIYMASAISVRAKLTPDDLARELTHEPGSSVEDRLLGMLVPALLSDPGQGKQNFPPYYQGKAAEWLKLLAPLGLWNPVDLRHPEIPGPPDSQDPPDTQKLPRPKYPGMSCIAWWNLHRGVPRLDAHQARWRAVVSGLLSFLVIDLIFLADRGWRYALLTSASYGCMVFFAAIFLAADRGTPATAPGYLLDRKHPALAWWFSQSWPKRRPVVLAAACTLVAVGLLIGYRDGGFHHHRGYWIWTGTKTGFFDGLNDGLIVVITYAIARVPRSPRPIWAIGSKPVTRSETQRFMLALLLGILFGLEWGTSAAVKGQHGGASTFGQVVLIGLITGIDFAIGAWLFHWSSSWSRPERANDPRRSARAELVGALLRPFILGFAFAFAFGISAPFNFTGVDVWAWFVVGVALGSLETEWPLYFAAIRTLRGRHQQLPIRLMRFLDICRSSGLLSSAGQAYQIHDDRLLQQMAGLPDGTSGVRLPLADRPPVAALPVAAGATSATSNGAADSPRPVR
jgi:hypothetical protein